MVDARCRGPGGLQLRPALGRLGGVHHHHPPALDRAALTGEDHTRQEPQRSHRPAASVGAVARPPPRRVRPREHPHLVERGGELLVAGDATAEHARADALRVAHLGGSAGFVEHGSQGPRRLPAPLLPPLRGRPRQPDRRGLQGPAAPVDPHQELPSGFAPGARTPRPRPPHGADHRSVELRRRRPAPVVRRDRCSADDHPSRRHLQRRTVAGAAHGRDPSASAGRLLQGRRSEARREHRVCGFHQRPATARMRGLSGGGEPRDAPRRDRSQTRVVGRGMEQGLGSTEVVAADRPHVE